MLAFILAGATILLFPFAVASAIGMLRRPPEIRTAVDVATSERLEQVERTLESLRRDMSRLDDAQRFMTKLLEQRPAKGRRLAE